MGSNFQPWEAPFGNPAWRFSASAQTWAMWLGNNQTFKYCSMEWPGSGPHLPGCCIPVISSTVCSTSAHSRQAQCPVATTCYTAWGSLGSCHSLTERKSLPPLPRGPQQGRTQLPPEVPFSNPTSFISFPPFSTSPLFSCATFPGIGSQINTLPAHLSPV